MNHNLKSTKTPILEILCVLYIVAVVAYFCGLAIGTFHGHFDNNKSSKVTETK